MAKYNFTEEEKQQIIDDYVNNWLSIRELMTKYNIKSHNYLDRLLKDVKRNLSEANKLARKKYPDSFKLSENTKEKVRQARLKFMKEHPEQTAWRKANMSYPEQQFVKFLEERGYSSKFLIERELSVFPYFIDFAFLDLKIAIEIDGSQHLEKNRKERDCKKDLLLNEKGWTVIRISENIVKTDWELLQNTLDKYINKDTDKTFERVGIIKAPKKKK